MFSLNFENWKGFQTDFLLQDTRKIWGIQHFKAKCKQLVIVGYVTATY